LGIQVVQAYEPDLQVDKILMLEDASKLADQACFVKFGTPLLYHIFPENNYANPPSKRPKH
jgi:hypothetical protein